MVVVGLIYLILVVQALSFRYPVGAIGAPNLLVAGRMIKAKRLKSHKDFRRLDLVCAGDYPTTWRRRLLRSNDRSVSSQLLSLACRRASFVQELPLMLGRPVVQ